MRLHWHHADCHVRFAEIIIREIERNHRFKVLKLLAEPICQTGSHVINHAILRLAFTTLFFPEQFTKHTHN
jgi:hypothetical protein